jgi:hypothetical protein
MAYQRLNGRNIWRIPVRILCSSAGCGDTFIALRNGIISRNIRPTAKDRFYRPVWDWELWV